MHAFIHHPRSFDWIGLPHPPSPHPPHTGGFGINHDLQGEYRGAADKMVVTQCREVR